MREIKFRAKDIDNNEWIYGTSPITFEQPVMMNIKDGYLTVTVIDKDTVGEFTGLNDKNGKEIYEGDVCKVWGHPQLEQNFEYDAVVIWLNSGFHFQKILPIQVIWDMGHNSCEIIGNIYEN